MNVFHMDDSKKTDVLLAALNERYTALHKIRERVESIGVWAIGLLLAAGGWLLQSHPSFSPLQKAFLVFAVLVALALLRFMYLEDLCRGFRSQLRVAARIEDALGLFTPKVFSATEHPIYPQSWKAAGTQEGDGRFFDANYVLLYVGVAFLVVCIILATPATPQPTSASTPRAISTTTATSSHLVVP